MTSRRVKPMARNTPISIALSRKEERASRLTARGRPRPADRAATQEAANITGVRTRTLRRAVVTVATAKTPWVEVSIWPARIATV